jgi:uncharacterized protein (DUF1015 family)
MRIRPFKAAYPNPNMITSADSFFGRMKEEYPHFAKSGFFLQDEDESLFIYQILGKNYQCTGIIGCNDVNDFDTNTIHKHEETLAAKEQNTMEIMVWRRAQIKPILLAFETHPKLDEWISEYIDKNKLFYQVEFKDEKEVHKLWKLSDSKDLSFVTDIFANEIPATYIADGHHRSATMLRLHNGGQFSQFDLSDILAVYMPFRDLRIYDYNRIVKLPFGLSTTRLMAQLSQYFDIYPMKNAKKPSKKRELVCCVNDEWYTLIWRPKFLESVPEKDSAFDTGLLDNYVFKNVFEIEDSSTDTSIEYIQGTASMKKVMKNLAGKSNTVGFFLYPVQKKELIATAGAGKNLPPKSTWFEPRIKNGLLVKSLEKNI